MPQTIHHRQQLRAMRRTSARRELRGNVIEWRKQAATRAVQLTPPPRPVRPLFVGKVENYFLALVTIATLAIAHKTGVLALIARAVGDLL